MPPFGAHDPTLAKFISNELSDANANVVGAAHTAYMPRFETCHDDDLYDVVLTSSSFVNAWKAWGYEPLELQPTRFPGSDGPAAATFELNGQSRYEKAAVARYIFELEDKHKTHSRVIMFLRCKELKVKVKEPPSPMTNYLKNLIVSAALASIYPNPQRGTCRHPTLALA